MYFHHAYWYRHVVPMTCSIFKPSMPPSETDPPAVKPEPTFFPARACNAVRLVSFRSGKRKLFRKMLLQDKAFSIPAMQSVPNSQRRGPQRWCSRPDQCPVDFAFACTLHHPSWRQSSTWLWNPIIWIVCLPFETACTAHVRTSSACTLREYIRRSRNKMNV